LKESLIVLCFFNSPTLNPWSLVFRMHLENPNLTSLLDWIFFWRTIRSHFVFSILLHLICSEYPDLSCPRFFPKTLTSFLNWKHFLKESSIMIYLFNFFVPNPLWSSRSFVSQIPSQNPNFMLKLKQLFEWEVDHAISSLEEKKRLTLRPKVVGYLNLPLQEWFIRLIFNGSPALGDL
jgi:hypothetical protein